MPVLRYLIADLREVLGEAFAKPLKGESPDQYHDRVGQCPKGYEFDGEHCHKAGTSSMVPPSVQQPGQSDSGDDEKDTERVKQRHKRKRKDLIRQ
jgi:hypothetical protein